MMPVATTRNGTTQNCRPGTRPKIREKKFASPSVPPYRLRRLIRTCVTWVTARPSGPISRTSVTPGSGCHARAADRSAWPRRHPRHAGADQPPQSVRWYARASELLLPNLRPRARAAVLGRAVPRGRDGHHPDAVPGALRPGHDLHQHLPLRVGEHAHRRARAGPYAPSAAVLVGGPALVPAGLQRGRSRLDVAAGGDCVCDGLGPLRPARPGARGAVLDRRAVPPPRGRGGRARPAAPRALVRRPGPRRAAPGAGGRRVQALWRSLSPLGLRTLSVPRRRLDLFVLLHVGAPLRDDVPPRRRGRGHPHPGSRLTGGISGWPTKHRTTTRSKSCYRPRSGWCATRRAVSWRTS